MPRPRLRPGEYGNVSAVKGPNGWTADAHYRRHDGAPGRCRATGPTKAAAVSRLRELLTVRIGSASTGDIDGDTLVSTLAEYHLTLERARDLAPHTIREISNVTRLYIVPRLGKLTLRECRTSHVERAITEIAAASPAQAKKARWVLSAMFKRAVRLDALPSSPVAAVSAVKVTHAEPKALTLEQLREVRNVMLSRTPPRGRESRTPARDVLEFLIGTGCRAAEALGLAWEDVDLDGEWVRIHRQVQRVTGVGLVRRETKEDDVRVLHLPPVALAMLRRRREADPDGELVFPSDAGGMRDPRNMRHMWDRALEGTGWEWVTQKVMRKTVATHLARAADSKAAAQQLGHTTDAVTRKHYIEPDRKPVAIAAMDTLVTGN